MPTAREKLTFLTAKIKSMSSDFTGFRHAAAISQTLLPNSARTCWREAGGQEAAHRVPRQRLSAALHVRLLSTVPLAHSSNAEEAVLLRGWRWWWRRCWYVQRIRPRWGDAMSEGGGQATDAGAAMMAVSDGVAGDGDGGGIGE